MNRREGHGAAKVLLVAEDESYKGNIVVFVSYFLGFLSK